MKNLLQENSKHTSLPEEDYYSKHRYQINIIECAYAVVQKLKSEQIPNHVIAEYAHKLKTGILAYKDSINYDKNASKVARMQACVIKPTHPSFDFWLALLPVHDKLAFR